MNIWSNYKKVLHETFPLHNSAGSVWAQWEGKGTSLLARTYTNQYFIKAREVEIWDERSCIYNNIISDALKEELKQLINEVLDERDLEKKLNGPYDFPEL